MVPFALVTAGHHDGGGPAKEVFDSVIWKDVRCDEVFGYAKIIEKTREGRFHICHLKMGEGGRGLGDRSFVLNNQ
jgi:hypothetical protein